MKLLTNKETDAIMNDLATLGDIIVEKVSVEDFDIGIRALYDIVCEIGGVRGFCAISGRISKTLQRNLEELEEKGLSETERDAEEV